MLNLHKTWLRWIILGLILPASTIYAADESAPNVPGNWSASFTVGLMTWSDLKNLQPAAGGAFNSLGIVMEFAGHKHVARWGSADVLIGVDLGIISTESDIPGITEDLTQGGLYLTPSIKFRFGERSRRYLNLEAGLGWYQVDFTEWSFCVYCGPVSEPYDEDTLGGYLGITRGFGDGLIIGLKAHFADFGQVTGLGPGTGDLSGPIYIFSLGGAFGA